MTRASSLFDSLADAQAFVAVQGLHILGALRDEHISLQKLRQAIAYLRRRVLDQRHPHPLLAVDLQTDGLSLFIRHLGQLLNVTREGQLAIKEVFEARLRRIERDPTKMTALRFCPYVRYAPVSTAVSSNRVPWRSIPACRSDVPCWPVRAFRHRSWPNASVRANRFTPCGGPRACRRGD